MAVKKILRYLYLCAVLVVILAIIFKTVVRGNFFKEFSAFLLGDRNMAHSGNMALVILTVISVQLMLDVIGRILINLFSKNPRVATFAPSLRELIFLSTVEEIIFRWLPMGALTTISFLSGDIAFYILFLSSNAVWALIHLENFKNVESPIIKVLGISNIFFCGLLLSFLFVKFGLLATIIAHVSLNLIYFGLNKCFKE